ncbi:MAG: DUF4175 family protein [Pseudomonadota bacterium]
MFLTLERWLRAFWLALSILGLTAAILFSTFGLIDPRTFATVATVGVGLSAWFFFKELVSFVPPTYSDAIARLDSGLLHSPVLTVHDNLPEGASDQTKAIWALHKAQAERAASRASTEPPRVRLAKQDRFALRLVTVLILGLVLVFGRDAATQLVEQTETGGLAAGPVALGPSFEGWIEPPAHAGQPVFYMDSDSVRELIVPRGSTVIFRVYGDADRAGFSESVSGTQAPLVVENAAIGEAKFKVTQDGEITLQVPRQDDETWVLAISPDDPPSVELDGEFERTVDGTMRLPFLASDDFGVMTGLARINLNMDAIDRLHGRISEPETQEAIILDLPVGLARNPKEIADVLSENLSRHPWANLPVTIELEVIDGAEQSGHALIEGFDLPGKRFFDPLASALIDQRAELLWNRDNAQRTSRLIRAITWKPEGLFKEEKSYLMVRTALRVLERNLDEPGDEQIAEVEDLLWRAAVLIEEGDLNNAAERLRRAQERLSEAMRRGASDDEIAELMQELREAMDAYMRALAQNAEPMDQQQSQNSTVMSQDQLQELMDRIQELMEQGRMDEAQQLLNQLMQMMENMRVVQGGQGQGEGQDSQQGQQQQMQDMLREQQDLADETFEQLQEQFNQQSQQGEQQGQQPGQQQGQQQGQQPGQQGQPNQLGQNGQQPGQTPGAQGQGQNGEQEQFGRGENGELPTAEELADRQGALERLLDQQSRDLGNGPGRDDLESAEESMGEAADNLREGDLRGALDRQADAMDQLRRGMSQMNEAQRRQAQQNGGQQGGDDDGFGDQAGNGGERDPLGRSRNNNGQFADGTQADLESRREFYRNLDAEIRKRAGDQTRPEAERDYLKRLLERF